jgi:hypothetical protein
MATADQVKALGRSHAEGDDSLTPLSHANGPRGTANNAWIVGGGQYHPASQYWPLQLARL